MDQRRNLSSISMEMRHFGLEVSFRINRLSGASENSTALISGKSTMLFYVARHCAMLPWHYADHRDSLNRQLASTFPKWCQPVPMVLAVSAQYGESLSVPASR